MAFSNLNLLLLILAVSAINCLPKGEDSGLPNEESNINLPPDYLKPQNYSSQYQIVANQVNKFTPDDLKSFQNMTSEYAHTLLRRQYLIKKKEYLEKRDREIGRRQLGQKDQSMPEKPFEIDFEVLIKSDEKLLKMQEDGIFTLQAKNILYNTAFVADVGIGTPENSYPVVMDTGSSDFWVTGIECGEDCPTPMFNSQQSKTFRRIPQKFTISYGDGSQARGYTGYDRVTVGGVTVQNMQVQVAEKNSDTGERSYVGILGLGFRTLASVKGTLTLLDRLKEQNFIKRAMIGVQLISRKLYSNQGGGGVFTFGGYDTQASRGEFATEKVISNYYWEIPMRSMRLGNVWKRNLQGGVLIDTGATLILLQDKIVNEFYKNIPGSAKIQDQWIVKCNISEDINFGRRNLYLGFGGKEFGIPATTLAWFPINKDYCYGAVQGGGDQLGISIVGAAFIKGVYAVFDQDFKAISFANRSDLPPLTD